MRRALFVLALGAAPGCALDPWVDIRDESMETRVESAAGLGDVTEAARVPEAGKLLREAWEREASALGRRAILQALARLGDPAGVALATEALADPYALVRSAATDALATLGVVGTRPDLVRLLREDREPEVRAAAARALGALADADPADLSAVPDLVARLEDEPAVALAAYGALQRLTAQPLPRDPAVWRAWWDAWVAAGPRGPG